LRDEQKPVSEDDGRETIARLAQDMLPKLIARLTKSDLGELEVREDGWRIRLRRPTHAASVAHSSHSQRPAHGSHSGAPQHGERGASPQRIGSQRSEPVRGLVTSVAVGYFVARDNVKVGSTLRSGDIVGHIDVLGVRQEVVTPIAGVVRTMEVEPGQAVEYGQPIARVEPGV
jgi:acetyl-CoA carboxylase biotin carboxyl carrier protein